MPVAIRNSPRRHAISPFWFLVSFSCAILVHFYQCYFRVSLSVCNVTSLLLLGVGQSNSTSPFKSYFGPFQSTDLGLTVWRGQGGRGTLDKGMAGLWVPDREPAIGHSGSLYGEADNLFLQDADCQAGTLCL